MGSKAMDAALRERGEILINLLYLMQRSEDLAQVRDYSARCEQQVRLLLREGLEEREG